ncbi:hypothetical protein [Streptomyces hokutonensis]|uniref:hypothetical protein n=1 Tax=Streptomyces hokutonensis TaxID=1306990 RepID=UPI003693ADCD
MGATKWSTVLGTAGLALAAVTVSATATAPAAAQDRASDARLAQRVVLTNVDSGRAVAASAGDDVEVRLTGYREGGLTYTWSVPAADDSTVLRGTGGTTTPSGGASAVLHADHSGVATVSAQRRCVPGPGRVCPQVITPWKVTVEVK